MRQVGAPGVHSAGAGPGSRGCWAGAEAGSPQARQLRPGVWRKGCSQDLRLPGAGPPPHPPTPYGNSGLAENHCWEAEPKGPLISAALASCPPRGWAGRAGMSGLPRAGSLDSLTDKSRGSRKRCLSGPWRQSGQHRP